jgi:hypothetical protein
MTKLQSKIRRNFADPTLYIYCRPTGIIEVRKEMTRGLKDLVIKRYPKWYPIDRIMLEMWERDTWSRDSKTGLTEEWLQKRKNVTTATIEKEQKRMNKFARLQDGKTQ